jgi:hypothetical protein
MQRIDTHFLNGVESISEYLTHLSIHNPCLREETKQFFEALKSIDFLSQTRAQQVEEIYGDDDDELFSLLSKSERNIPLDCPES